MPARPLDYEPGDLLTEEIDLGEHPAMPLRRLGPDDSVTVVLQHRRDHDLSLRYTWSGVAVKQTGARAVTVAVPVDDLPKTGRWALWAEAQVGAQDLKHPERGRNIRIAE
jgi:hypothetical protein